MIEYYLRLNITDKEVLYRIDESRQVQRYNVLNREWSRSVFTCQDIRRGAKKVNPLTYEHPAFVKIQFYKDVLGGLE